MADDLAAGEPVDTIQLHRWVQQWRNGDAVAIDSLLRVVGLRLEALNRKMLRGFPALRNWYDTHDVVQGSTLRLLKALRKLEPRSTRDFFNLAAANSRRELIDLARRVRGKNARSIEPDDSQSDGIQVGAADEAIEELELWSRFHEAVDDLPVEEREVMSLTFYHGWSQAQIAELLDVDVRTVRRRWQIACRKLTRQLGGKLPSADDPAEGRENV